MRKFTLLFAIALFAATASFAQDVVEQENESQTTGNPTEYNSNLAVGVMGAEGAGFYLMWEILRDTEKGESLSFLNNGSIYFRVHQTFESQTVRENFNRYEIKAVGMGAELGTRTYYSKTKKGRGLFTGNSLKYYRVKYDDSRFKGTYSYFSFFAPEVGYKIGFGKSKRLNLEFLAGTEWAIEIKGKGDIDNREYDNWKFKAGIGIGYAFY